MRQNQTVIPIAMFLSVFAIVFGLIGCNLDNKYTVTFINGYDTVKVISVNSGEKIDDLPIPEIPAYTDFKGWFTKREGKGNEFTTKTKVDSNLTVYAHFIINIDEQIRWANSAKLTITVAIPNGWGTSPQLGTDKTFDNIRTNETPRSTYPFDVEFTINHEYEFVAWLAFSSDDFILEEVAAIQDFEIAQNNSLEGKGVNISPHVINYTGAFVSTVTVNVPLPITLIPFSVKRY